MEQANITMETESKILELLSVVEGNTANEKVTFLYLAVDYVMAHTKGLKDKDSLITTH